MDEDVPLFRQWGAERLTLPLGHHRAAWVRITVSGPGLPFTGASLFLAAAPPAPPVLVGARLTGREEFAGETVLTANGVKIIGNTNIPATVAAEASALYARNLLNFLQPAYDKEAKAFKLNPQDDVIGPTIIVSGGQVVYKKPA